MPFRHKISIAFSLVLLLTILVSLGSWQTMKQALNSQQELYAFQTHIERTFNAIISQEQAFTTQQAIHHSTLVFEHIGEMRRQVERLLAGETLMVQRNQLTSLLATLADYELAFATYVQYHLDMQTIRSRLGQETLRLQARIDEFDPPPSALASTISRLAMGILLHQKEYIIEPRQESLLQLTQTTAELHEAIDRFHKTHQGEHLALLAYRIGRATTAATDVFTAFIDMEDQTDTALHNLRSVLFRLNTGYSDTITGKTNLVNQQIAFLQKLTLFSAAIAILLSIGATLVLSRFITRPIEMLKRSALRIVNGDLNTTVAIDSRDEIGELGHLFNTMTERLRTNFKELEQYRERLEELVRERTKELELEIVERRETERQLAASEQRFRTIFDSSHDGILIADPASGSLILANQTIGTMLGYKQQELMTMTVAALHPEKDREWILTMFDRGARGLGHQFKDIPMLRKDGSILPVEILTSTISINDQPYLLGSFRDISERKSMEEERLKVRKLESVGVLAGGIAHDFNNILAAILGNVSLALALTEPEDSRFPLLSQLEKASLRAKDLTHQLLTFSKGGEPVKEVTSIADIIKESAGFILRGSNIRCDVDLPGDLWSGEVDGGQISQVVQNIVVNARHAMPEGGVVSITGRNITACEDESDSRTLRKWIEITIADNGTGIPEEYRERIFDPYFTTKKGGSGLGLAISHSIIRKHKGKISVHCPPEGGTSFTLLLPAVESAAPRKPVDARTVSEPGSGTVLVMDDEQPVREILQQLLNHLGYGVVATSDGRQAIDAYRRLLDEGNPPDLVIMDLTIPGGMGGREAARELLTLDPDARLIVSSGYSQDPIMANHRQFGFQGFLHKPFQLRDLQTLLQQLAR